MSKSKYGSKEAGLVLATNTQLEIVDTNVIQVIKINHLNVKYNVFATFSKNQYHLHAQKTVKNIIYLHRN